MNVAALSRDLDLWAYQRSVMLDFSRPGKPTDNVFIESLNGKFRAECLNARWFKSLDDARQKCGCSSTGARPQFNLKPRGATSKSSYIRDALKKVTTPDFDGVRGIEPVNTSRLLDVRNRQKKAPQERGTITR